MTGNNKTPIYANPFVTWQSLVNALRGRFQANLDLDGGASTDSDRLLEALNSLAEECDSAAKLVDRLEAQNKTVFMAFQRALIT